MLEKTCPATILSGELIQQMIWVYNISFSCWIKYELLMKNHELCPTDSQAFLKMNVNTYTNSRHNRGGKRGCCYYHCGGHRYAGLWNNRNEQHRKWNVYERHNKENGVERKKMLHIITKKNCYRCGRKCHWSHTCNTDKHLVDLYYTSKKWKRKIKTNLVNNSC